MYDVIIIGSGPAGYTAAIYSSRSFLKTLVLDGNTPGGQLTTTTDVENFPGFTDGVMGPELMAKMRSQAERFGTEFKSETVVSIGAQETASNAADAGNMKQNTDSGQARMTEFSVKTESGEYQTRSVIIATGASAKRLGIPSEETYRGKGISYCATCDGFFFKNREIAVFGGGDTAMEEATYLTKFASKVTIIHRRDEFRASKIMLEKAKSDPKITFLTNKAIEEFTGEVGLRSVKLKDTVTGEIMELPIGGAFVAIGHTPSTAFLQGLITMDKAGYIITKMAKHDIHNSQLTANATDESQIVALHEIALTQTNVPGIFAAGDCVDSRYRQGVVAAGQGAMAAIDAERYLAS